MPTRNVNLTDRYDQFVEEQVASGLFKNASEVMRAGLRLLEQHEREEQEKLATLRALAEEGFEELDQGRGIVLNSPEDLSEFIGGLGRRVANQADDSERHSSQSKSPNRSSKRKNSKSTRSAGPRRTEKS